MASRRAIATLHAQAIARLGRATSQIQAALGVEPVDVNAGIRASDPVEYQQARRLDALATLLERIAEKLIAPTVRVGTLEGVLADYAEGVSEPGPGEQLPAPEGATPLPPVVQADPVEQELPPADPQLPRKGSRRK